MSYKGFIGNIGGLPGLRITKNTNYEFDHIPVIKSYRPFPIQSGEFAHQMEENFSATVDTSYKD